MSAALLFHLRIDAASGFVIAAAVQAGSASLCTLRSGRAGIWHLFEEHLKTPLPRKLTLADDRKIWKIAKRGGFTLNIAGRQEIEEALRQTFRSELCRKTSFRANELGE